MNALVKITVKNDGQQTVEGRELHAALGVETPYDKWFPRMVEYGFEAEKDFSTFLSGSTGGRPKTYHVVSLDMAKHIAMIQRTEKGKRIREYFIEAEKQLWAQSNTSSLTADYLTRRLEAVEAELFAARKIIDFYENSDDVFDFDYVAAAISKYMKPPFGVKHLCQWLEKRGVLTHRAYKNDKPRQEYIDRKWFEPKNHTWRQRGKCRHTQTYWFTARGLNGVIRMAIEEKMLLLPTPAQSIFPVLIGHDGSRRIG